MKTLKTLLFISFFAFNFSVITAQIKIGQGVTSPNDWVDNNTTGIYVDVDTKSCGFTTTPHYLVTLESISNKGFHWYISGVPAIYNTTPTGFRVYLRWTDAPSDLPTVGSLNFPNPLRASTAQDRDWVIRLTAIEMQDCSPSRLDSNAVNTIFSGAFGKDGDILPKDNNVGEIDTTPENNLKIFPNPSSNILNVEYNGGIEKHEIYNLNFQLLGTYHSNTIDIKKFPKGNYLLKTYTSQKGIVTKQFVK